MCVVCVLLSLSLCVCMCVCAWCPWNGCKGLQLARDIETQSLRNLHILGSRVGKCDAKKLYVIYDYLSVVITSSCDTCLPACLGVQATVHRPLSTA